jgi:hypothetical protein
MIYSYIFLLPIPLYIREFFANRAAAQAVKARADAYDRYGSEVFEVSAPLRSDGSEAEARIALLKAHREQERERGIAQKETEVNFMMSYLPPVPSLLSVFDTPYLILYST